MLSWRGWGGGGGGGGGVENGCGDGNDKCVPFSLSVVRLERYGDLDKA